MSNIIQSVTELIGNTPLMELAHIEKDQKLKARLLGKLEYLNATGSIKDRIARKKKESCSRDRSLLNRRREIRESVSLLSEPPRDTV